MRLYVKGDVIGVGFRAWTKIQAKAMKITGWTKNVYDDPSKFGEAGGVEIVAQADEKELGDFIEKVKEGSPVSRVDDVEVLIEKVSQHFDSFDIIK